MRPSESDSFLFNFESPLGLLHARINVGGIQSLTFKDEKIIFEDSSQQENVLLIILELAQNLGKQLEEYFSGQREIFSLPLSPKGTSFQNKVWNALLEIPYGKVISYQKQALNFGDAKSIRAIAHANALNPIAILIPCHRVIGSDGSLTGYAGGIWRKKWLLEHEGSLSRQENLFD